MTSTFRVNPANVVHDVFDDGEAAIIDLRSGTYFSLNQTAAALWPALVAGTTIEQLAAAGAARWANDSSVAPAVRAFVLGLEREGLIESLEGVDPPTPEIGPGDGSFEAPTFERFDDLQELLLLDPIHDVGEGGWPRAAEG